MKALAISLEPQVRSYVEEGTKAFPSSIKGRFLFSFLLEGSRLAVHRDSIPYFTVLTLKHTVAKCLQDLHDVFISCYETISCLLVASDVL